MSAAMLLRNAENYRETMPQTVPCSAGFSPLPDYLSSFAADSFDLSLLPDDGAVPSSPTQLMAFCEASSFISSSPPAFHSSSTSCDPLLDLKCYIKEEPLQSALSPCGSSSGCSSASSNCNFSCDYASSSASSSCSSPSGARHCPSPDFSDLLSDTKDDSEIRAFLQEQQQQQDQQNISNNTQHVNLRSLLQEPPVRNQNTELEGLLQNTSNLRGLLEDPPARANIDLWNLLQESQQETLVKPAKRSAAEFDLPRPCKRAASDHQLLREVLRDTSFQRRFNVKPLELDELEGGLVQVKSEPASEGVLLETAHLGAEAAATVPVTSPSLQHQQQQQSGAASGELSERIGPVLSIALQHFRREVDNTCSVLGISTEPTQWTVDDVKAWLLWTLRQFNLPMIAMEYFNMDGAALVALTEQDFENRAPQGGSTLYAQLEVWKAASADRLTSTSIHHAWSSMVPVVGCENNGGATPALQDPSEDDDDDDETDELCDVASPGSSSAASVAGTSSGPSPGTTSAPSRGGGSHIHLWQFLKELLSQPQVHGSCIRWLDRSKGVFKIEDSVRVARLWGRRKNRPAMNYDKLSRSIRQYYKKGIMKKTERSQRLVYQFCHPYCL